MSAIDLPPGLGLSGTPFDTFVSPPRARRLSGWALAFVFVLGALTWYLVSRHPFRRGSSTQVVLPVAFAAFASLGALVRRARVEVTRDGIRWGWSLLGFHQSAAQIAAVHVYADGVSLEATRGSRWFLSERDWARFDGLVRQIRRAGLPVREHSGAAPLRARLQSYGRFLDGLLVASVVAAFAVAVWAA
ncbi:MAG TPA: hypothetical protein VGM88_24650 [Kofleriaceae bacterium]